MGGGIHSISEVGYIYGTSMPHMQLPGRRVDGVHADSPRRPPTYSLTRSLARSLVHPPTHSPTRPFTHQFARSFNDSLIHSLANSLTHSPNSLARSPLQRRLVDAVHADHGTCRIDRGHFIEIVRVLVLGQPLKRHIGDNTGLYKLTAPGQNEHGVDRVGHPAGACGEVRRWKSVGDGPKGPQNDE